MYKNILVPLDGSLEAERALPFAMDLVRLSGGKLILARVVPSAVVPPPLYSMADADIWLIRQKEFRQEAETYLSVVADSLSAAGAKPTCLVLAGPIGETLLRLIDQMGIDIVVVSTRKHGMVMRFLLGSTTDYLVHNAPVPVLLVRDRDE